MIYIGSRFVNLVGSGNGGRKFDERGNSGRSAVVFGSRSAFIGKSEASRRDRAGRSRSGLSACGSRPTRRSDSCSEAMATGFTTHDTTTRRMLGSRRRSLTGSWPAPSGSISARAKTRSFPVSRCSPTFSFPDCRPAKSSPSSHALLLDCRCRAFIRNWLTSSCARPLWPRSILTLTALLAARAQSTSPSIGERSARLCGVRPATIRG